MMINGAATLSSEHGVEEVSPTSNLKFRPQSAFQMTKSTMNPENLTFELERNTQNDQKEDREGGRPV